MSDVFVIEICDGCNTTDSSEDVRHKNPNALSCCPERKMVPTQVVRADELDRLTARIKELEAEVAEWKSTAANFIGVHAVKYGKSAGFAEGEIHPTHYDLLAKTGCRMNSFRRARAILERKD